MRRGVVLTAGLVVAVLILARCGISWHVGKLLKRADSALLIDDDPELAERTSKELLDWDNDHPQGLLIHGVALARQGHLEQALDFLQRVPDGSPFRKDAETTIGTALIRLHRYRQAEAQLRANLARDSSDDSARSELFSLLLLTMRVEEAIHLYEVGLTGTQQDIPRLTELLKILAETAPARRRRDGIRKYCRNLEGEPDALAALGQTSALLGEPEEAEKYFRQAIDADPGNQRILIWAAEFFLSQGEESAARAILHHCSPPSGLTTPPDKRRYAEYQRIQAELSLKDGNLEAALDSVESSLEAWPYGPAFSLKADILRQVGRASEALEAMAELSALGQADLKMIRLHTAAQMEPVTPELCAELSASLSRLGRGRQAEAWASIGVQLRKSNRAVVYE